MPDPLCQQLYQVAKLIKHRDTVGGSRHLYFVSLGGFDHHGDQLRQQAALLGQLGTGVAAFWNALNAIGAQDMATLFTESDFGRTFKPNASGGTDHAWGNQHFVVGGAVNGGRSFGRYPSLVVGGPGRCCRQPVGAAGPLDSGHFGRPVRRQADRLVQSGHGRQDPRSCRPCPHSPATPRTSSFLRL